MVIVDQTTSAAGSKSPRDSVHEEENTGGHSTNDLLLRSGLSVPGDPSQPVWTPERCVVVMYEGVFRWG